MGAVQVTATLADAWWIPVFLVALVLVAQVPPRRPGSENQRDGADRPRREPGERTEDKAGTELGDLHGALDT